MKRSKFGGGITLGHSETSPEKASPDSFHQSSTPLQLYPAAAINITRALQNSSGKNKGIFLPDFALKFSASTAAFSL
jgi:hypothetical protein